MNKQIKAKWVKALESGKYRRAKGQLKDGNGYCCLGVLCKEMGVEFDPDEFLLPTKLRRAAGLTPTQETFLANANDGLLDSDADIKKRPKGYRSKQGTSFKALAAYIRGNL